MSQHDNEGLFDVEVVGDRVIAVGDHDYVAKSTRAWEAYALPCNDGDCLFSQDYLNPH